MHGTMMQSPPFFTYAPNFDKQKACQAQKASVTLTYLMSTEYENT